MGGKPGGIVYDCPTPLSGSGIDLEQLCSSLGEIITNLEEQLAWLKDIQKICEALPPGMKHTQIGDLGKKT